MPNEDETRIKTKATVTRDQIVSGLREIGLREGDLVQVHSSLKSFGYVEGGAEAVVDALLDAVGPSGTVMMPTFNHGRAELFDLRETPSYNGLITETLRKRPEAVRGLHPTHAYAAIGPAARELTSGHQDVSTFSIECPLGRLAQRGGWVLMLGAPLNTNTIAHVGETLAGAHCLGYRQSPRKVRDEGGAVVDAWSDRWRDGKCPIEWDPLYERLRGRGQLRRGRIGDAEIHLMKGMDVIQATVELAKEMCPACPVQPKKE